MSARAAIALGALLALARAEAQSFPARSGESGIIDVPDAEVVGVGSGQFAAELRFDQVEGQPSDLGPLPAYVVAGVLSRLDLGLTMREWGQPGDPRPARMMFGAAAKLQLWAPDGAVPGAAFSTVFDRMNGRGVVGTRLVLSTGRLPFRLAAFGGVEAPADDWSDFGITAGGAAAVPIGKRLELAVEALTGPRGQNFGGAIRWTVAKTVGVSLGANYLPGDEGLRVSMTLAFSPPLRKRVVAPEPVLVPEAPTEVATGPTFTDDRPRFRLRIPVRSAQQLGAHGHVQHGPPTPATAVAAAAPAKPEAGGARPAAPGIDDLASAQVRDQEALADARERRVRAAGEQLDAREAAAAEETTRLNTRERELTALEQQIAAREERTAVRTPSQQQRQLEAIAAQFASQERNLAAQEKSYLPALDAAESRERGAAMREQEEAAEVARLSASIAPDMAGTAQVAVRRLALAARNRKLAAMETRLLARGERIDATERQLRTRRERLEAWMQRLNTRLERLQLLEKLLEPARTPPPAPKPAEDKGAAAPPKDKPAFVMVVKAPTAIVKAGAREGSGAAGGGSSPGVSGEKAVIAATVVMFPTPTTQISELDRETLDNIARLAAKEGGELLVWARAKDPSLVPQAERRAAEIQARARTAGPLEASRITTRVTMRPGALGVDVVVSALREAAKPAEAPAPSDSTKLLAGESGNRQIRDAVQSAQGSIEACVGEVIEAKKIAKAEGVLKLTVAPSGRVSKVAAGAGDLSGAQFEGCLEAASRDWTFPSADGEYVVDVPITVIRGGASR